MQSIIVSLFFVIVLMSYVFIALHIVRRQRARRKVEAPEKFVLLRNPGESLRKEIDALTDQLISHITSGALGALFLMGAPLLLLYILPRSDWKFLLLSGVALFAAGSVWVIRKASRLLEERANKHLGYLGERFVSEELQRIRERAFVIYHDVPIMNKDWTENVDHLAIGPLGAAVIETKTRSKPIKGENGLIEVRFDGEYIHWPRYQNDVSPLNQVERYAEWLGRLIQAECGVAVQVGKVVAIPGWSVKERKITRIRVVSGRGVADAVLSQVKLDSPVFSKEDVGKICKRLEELCRDVTE